MAVGALGLDHAGRPGNYPTFVRQAVDMGFSFEFRYLCLPDTRPINRSKIARVEEIQAAHAAGMDVGLVWQDTKHDARAGHDGGVWYGTLARQQAEALGAPDGTWIYFAVADYDAPETDHALLSSYVSGIRSVLGPYKVAGYGKNTVGAHLLSSGLVEGWWQSYGFSKPVGKIEPWASVYQRREQVHVAEVLCDVNEARLPEMGLWSAPRRTPVQWFPFALKNPAPEQYWGIYSGGPMKGVIHTTETPGFTPHSNLYGGWHTSYPHFTVILTQSSQVVIYQHIPLDRAARALKNQSGGVQTNNDSAIQIEIVWYAQDAQNMPRVLLDTVRALMRWLEHECGVARRWYGDMSHFYPPEGGHRLGFEPWRMAGSTWDNWNGWCGHQNVPENTHGDPGKIDVQYLLADPLEIDMPAPNHITAVVKNPAGPGYWLLEAQGGVITRANAPFKGSIFNLPAEKRQLDPDEFFVGLVPKTSGSSLVGYVLVTNKGDGYDFPLSS